MKTIPLIKSIRTQQTVQKENFIVKCNQKDDRTQKTGILTIQEEIQLLKRGGTVFKEKAVEEIHYEKAREIEKKNYAEIFDLYDDKRKLDKEIKENNKKLQELSEENKKIYESIERASILQEEKTKDNKKE